MSKDGPDKGIALKNNSAGKYKWEHNSLQPQKQTTSLQDPIRVATKRQTQKRQTEKKSQNSTQQDT